MKTSLPISHAIQALSQEIKKQTYGTWKFENLIPQSDPNLLSNQ
jgi:post-segregation antitoxin (ccd killing protein)